MAQGRFEAMDGVRGWAALSVATYHLLWETFGVRFPEIRSLPVASLLNGPFAVSIFFVISGYVLTANDWLTDDKEPVRRQLVKRYSRLTVPILVASSIVLLLMLSGLTYNREAGTIVGRDGWLGTPLAFDPSLGTLLQYAVIDVSLDVMGHDYGPFLWTMKIELWGSVLVLCISLRERQVRSPLVLLAAIGAFFLWYDPLWSGFFFGAMISYAHRSGQLWQAIEGRAATVTAILVLVAVLVTGGVVMQINAASEMSNLTMHFLNALLAPLALIAISASKTLCDLFSTPLSRWLGKLSFPLYLMHFPVLVSLTSWLIVQRGGALAQGDTLWIAGLSLCVSLAAAVAFLPIEGLTASVGTRLADRLRPRKGLSAASPLGKYR